MAMHDHRVFRHLEKWWGAVVLGGGGVSVGGIPSITRERVFFTCLYEPTANSKSAPIPAGWLNQLSHDSIAKLLSHAEDFGSRWEMIGYNQPAAEDYFGYSKYRDSMGLEWVYKEAESVGLTESGTTEMRPCVEFVCLDDSALKQSVYLPTSFTWSDAKGQWGEAVVSALVDSIHESYRSLEPDWAERSR